ncbi:MAG TPA: hypothetical protein VL974_00160 [Magnetospirillum sp.]|jgi:hypothetical protein|nr:hypothetical protein [Magnetospirillum sp.]
MRASRLLLLTLPFLTVGCADPEPFVWDGRSGTTQVFLNKQVDPVVRTGQFYVCYSDATPWEEVVALATERCAAHGLKLQSNAAIYKWRCRLTSPHQASFACYDPDMFDSRGYINPFNKAAVARWEQATGKTAKPHNFMTMAGEEEGGGRQIEMPAYVPGPPPPPQSGVSNQPPTPAPQVPSRSPEGIAPPPPAQLTPVPPLSPADIAGKPALPPPPRLDAPPPPPPLAPDNFSLPPGSWGDHFQE